MEISEGNTPYGISTDKRITRRILKENKPVICKPNPIEIALKYQQLYEQTGSMTAIGQQLSVSRVRIHQILNLLKLDQRIIEYLISITDPKQINYWTEHKLRRIVSLPKEEQYKSFKELLIN